MSTCSALDLGPSNHSNPNQTPMETWPDPYGVAYLFVIHLIQFYRDFFAWLFVVHNHAFSYKL